MNPNTEKKNKKEYDLAPLKRVIKAYKEEYPIGFSLGYIFTQIETLPDKMQEVETEEKLYLSLFLTPNMFLYVSVSYSEEAANETEKAFCAVGATLLKSWCIETK